MEAGKVETTTVTKSGPGWIKTETTTMTSSGEPTPDPSPSNSIVFALNGTKIGCGEGGCGACAVVISRKINGKVVHGTCNACLRPLAACDGAAILTTEGIGSKANGFHPVQDRLAAHHGSQCGFCSPGMVMAIYGSLAKGETSMQELEHCLDGNLCRCTGYRPILDAAKSFASNRSDETVRARPKLPIDPELSSLPATDVTPVFPTFLESFGTRPLELRGSGRVWRKVITIAAAQEAVTDARARGLTAKVVGANTSVGIYKTEVEDPEVLIDVSAVPELLEIHVVPEQHLEFGVANSLEMLIRTLKRLHTKDVSPGKHLTAAFPQVVKHMLKIASHHIRHVGTVGGNLMMAKLKGFASDLATLLVGLGATASCISPDGTVMLPIPIIDFLATPHRPGELLQSVTIPFGVPDQIFASFKVALRPQNSHALVNAAFAITVDRSTLPSSITAARLVFGVTGRKHAVIAAAAEAALVGRPLSDEVVSMAANALAVELPVLEEPAPHHRKPLRDQLMRAYLIKTLDAIRADGAVAPRRLKRAVSNGSEMVTVAPMSAAMIHSPISAPVAKISAKIQASGEARYTDDVPLSDSLHAALVGTPIGRATIKAIDPADALSCPGVVTVITAADIPGQNVLGTWLKEEILASSTSAYVGQPCAIVVADTLRHAQYAAEKVLVTCIADPAGLPLVTNADAVAADSFYTQMERRHTRGDAAAGLAAAEHTLTGASRTETQMHWYLEPQCAWASPDEGEAITVGSSNQWTDGVQVAVAKVLGIGMHDVTVLSRRAGGGFGGKLVRHIPVAACAALAAAKLNRSVRLTLDRRTDMRTTGGRHAVDASFEAGFDRTGKITALKLDILMNAGFNPDLSDFCVKSIAKAVDQTYWIANLEIVARATKTHLPTRGAMRGPGEIQASFVIEDVIEKVAAFLYARYHPASPLSVLANTIRKINTYPEELSKLVTHEGIQITLDEFSFPAVWSRVHELSQFECRAAEVDAFNSRSRWIKRGIAVTPVKYYVGAKFRDALVNVYGDGTVLVSHSGHEIGQGINTKVAQAAAYGLSKLLGPGSVPLDIIKVADTNTQIIPNVSMTGGSTTSEASCAAVIVCCEQLVERLAPVRRKLIEEHTEAETKAEIASEKKEYEDDGDANTMTAATAAGSRDKTVPADAAAVSFEPTWEAVIARAKGTISLSSQAMLPKPGATDADPTTMAAVKRAGFTDIAKGYHNFGAACTEVEVDVLTGEHTILRTDLVYDCGKSLNPAIDLGQCEGGFVQGLGFYFREDALIEQRTGRLLSDGTWEYKPPCSLDIPVEFNIEFLQDRPFAKGVLSSKASGEPPLVLATSAFAAVRHAVAAARADAEITGPFDLNTPATVDAIAAACRPALR